MNLLLSLCSFALLYFLNKNSVPSVEKIGVKQILSML